MPCADAARRSHHLFDRSVSFGSAIGMNWACRVPRMRRVKMIHLIQGNDRHLYPREIASMHRLRAKVFHERMKWPVDVADGQECDAFDDLDPLYVLVVGPTGTVEGSARLLPTTGPTMLSNVFGDLVEQGQQIRSPTIWESSRFSVQQEDLSRRTDKLINRTTAELLCGIVEVGIRSGLEFIVSVVDVSVELLLRQAGRPCDRLGKPRRIGKSLAIAGLFEMSEDLLAGFRRAG